MRGLMFSFVALILAAFFATGTFAQEVPPVTAVSIQSPFLTLDRKRLFSETLFGKAVEARFKADSDALIAENLLLEKALEAEERDLTDRRAKLPAVEFQVLAGAFDTKAERIRAAQEAKSRAISTRYEMEQKRFLEAAIPVLGELMRDNGAAVIIDKNTIILSLRGIDITDQAIFRMNAAFGSGDVSLSPAEVEPKPQP